MKCERCGSDTRMQVQAVISAPGELAHRFSKQNLRRSDVYLMGVLWETADFICTNPKCGKVLDGYGNYVTDLKKETKRLTQQRDNLLAALKDASVSLECFVGGIDWAQIDMDRMDNADAVILEVEASK